MLCAATQKMAARSANEQARSAAAKRSAPLLAAERRPVPLAALMSQAAAAAKQRALRTARVTKGSLALTAKLQAQVLP